MSVSKGFSSGFGCVLGLVAAVIVMIGALRVAANYFEPCPSCFTTDNCVLCSGSGKGIVWGDCMKCDGKKKCRDCGAAGGSGRSDRHWRSPAVLPSVSMCRSDVWDNPHRSQDFASEEVGTRGREKTLELVQTQAAGAKAI